MPAGGVVSAVRCQLRGLYSASRWNREGGGGSIVNGLAATDKQAIASVFGVTTRLGRDRDVTNRSFSHQR